MWQVLAAHERLQGRWALLDTYDSVAAIAQAPPVPASLTQWTGFAAHLKSLIVDRLGLLPPCDWEPHWETLGITQFEAYTLERLVVYSRPGFAVTANLYVPRGLGLPLPAILCPHGHARDGKAHAAYQALYISLARLGFVVLAPDCVGYGEREKQGHWRQGAPFLVGTSLVGLELWDNMKCIDALAARSEVDADRMGCIGNSGGGAQAMWCFAMDCRIKVAVVSDATAPFWYNHSKERELCPCCMAPRLLADAEMHHVLGLAAPRPLLLLGGALDSMFPRDLQRQVYRRVRRIYRLFDAGDRLRQVITPEPHSLSKAKREAVCSFFLEHLAGRRGPVSYHEPEDIAPLPPDHAALVCFPVRPPLLETPLPAALHAEYLHRKRNRAPGPQPGPGAERTYKRQLLRELLRLQSDTGPKRVSRSAAGHWQGYQAENVVLWSDMHTPLAASLVYPAGDLRGVVIIVDAAGKGSAWVTTRARHTAADGFVTVALDLRGWGELKPTELSPDGKLDELVAVQKGLGYDVPLMGLRVLDVLSTVHWARLEWDQAEVQLMACGFAGPVVLMAAVIDHCIARVSLAELPATLLPPHVSGDAWPAFLAVPDLLVKIGDVEQLLELIPPERSVVESLMPGVPGRLSETYATDQG